MSGWSARGPQLAAVALAVLLGGCALTRNPSTTAGAPHPIVLPAHPPPTISAISFPTALDGWMALSSSGSASPQTAQSIVTTSDGGSTWHTSWKGGLFPFFSTFAGAEAGWVLAGESLACGQPGTPPADCPSSVLLATADGGASWHQLPALPTPVWQVAFATPELGIAATAPSCMAEASLSGAPCPGAVLLTTDGGVHWSTTLRTAGLVSAIAARGDTLWAVTGVPGLEGVTGSPHLLVMRSVDQGGTWTQVASLGPLSQIGPGLEARLQLGPGGEMWLSYLEQDSCAMHGCSVGGFESVDGGLRWRANGPPDPTPQAECGDFAPPGAVAIAPTGTVIGTYQSSLATCEAPAAFLSKLVDGEWRPVHRWNFFQPRELTYPSAEVGYGENGSALLATRDGGGTWTQVWPGLSPTGGLDAISSAIAFGYGSLGSDSSVLETRDSGRSWSRVSQLPTQVLALDMIGPEVGFAAAAGTGAALQSFDLYRTADGGRSWTMVGPGFPLQGWGVLGLWLTASGSGVGAIAGTEEGTGLPYPTGFFAASDGGRRWEPEGSLASGYNLVASTTFKRLGAGRWLGLAEVNHGRGTELEESQDLGHTWSLVPGAPTGLAALDLSGDRGSVVAAQVGAGDNPLVRIYLASTAGGKWRPAAARPAVARGGALSAPDISIANSETVWLLTAGAVWETTDGGASWRPA